MTLRVDTSIIQAVENWVNHALPPGSCTELLLRGKYDEAFLYSHHLIRPYWDDHIAYINTIPLFCRNDNYDKWKGMDRYLHRVELQEDIFTL